MRRAARALRLYTKLMPHTSEENDNALNSVDFIAIFDILQYSFTMTILRKI